MMREIQTGIVTLIRRPRRRLFETNLRWSMAWEPICWAARHRWSVAPLTQFGRPHTEIWYCERCELVRVFGD